MGIAQHVLPRLFWKYVKGVKGVENTWDDEKVLWGSVEALQTMASQAQNPTERAVAAVAVLSTVVGLCVGEMAGIKVPGHDGI